MLKNIARSPYDLFIIAAIQLLFISFLYWGQRFDIQLHDTYFVVQTPHLFYAGIIFLLVFWSLYRLAEDIPWSKALIWAHVLFSIVIPLAFCIGSAFIYEAGYDDHFSDGPSFKIQFQAYTLIAFMFTQLIFVINLLVGLTRYVLNRYKK